ncbi:MAG TPA: hypothetical protein VFO18_03310 [Methylomirabilota bacterium]|nr:hypothetical protein [Methylomirabilota bacterium]
MADDEERCPYLVPVLADHLWMFPVPAYCRRPNSGVHVPSVERLVRTCLEPSHEDCPGYQAAMESVSPAG